VQATETIKLLTGIGEPLYGRLLQIDALRMEFHEFRLQKDPACPVCGEQPTIREPIDYEALCGVGPQQPAGAGVPEVSAAEVAARRARGAGFLLLDVREPHEHAAARIEGARLLPLGELAGRVGELADWRQRPVVVHCHHGGRSRVACELLRERGFERVENLSGGIEAWSLTVDPGVPRY
jgi:adenylyltransferase/sulfurtransferase